MQFARASSGPQGGGGGAYGLRAGANPAAAPGAAGTTRNLKNSEVFRGQGATGAATSAIWVGKGVTRTKPSTTLFVTNVPGDVSMLRVEALFKPHNGFVAFRTVRRMCFVDFDSIHAATASMRLVQGHRFSEAVGGAHRDRPAAFKREAEGLVIDYDKDSVDKRNRNYEQQRRELERKALTKVFCTVCGSLCARLAQYKRLAGLPARRTDGALCVPDASLAELCVLRGKVVLVARRAEGEGEGAGAGSKRERQYRVRCTGCEATVGYRCVPWDEIGAVALYVLPGALSDDLDEVKAGMRKLVEPAPAVAGPAPPPSRDENEEEIDIGDESDDD